MKFEFPHPLWLADPGNGKIYTKWALSLNQLFHVHFYQRSKARTYHLAYPINSENNQCSICLKKPSDTQQFQIDLLCKKLFKRGWMSSWPGSTGSFVNGREIRLHLTWDKKHFTFDSYDSHMWDGENFSKTSKSNKMVSKKGALYRDLCIYRDFISHYGADERWCGKKIEIPSNRFIV